MSYDELLKIASKKGAVQWHKSQKIEFLRLTLKREILALRILPESVTHIIQKQDDDYQCEEITWYQSVAMDSFIWDYEQKL